MCRSVLHLKKMRSRLPRKNPSTSLRLVPLPLGKGGADFWGAVCGGAHGPRPTAEYFVGQGPRALPEVREKLGSGRCRHRPLRSFHFTVVGADDSVCPGPITQHLVGQGPCALPWVRHKVGRADVGIGPYGGGYKGRNGRVVQETGPTKFCVSVFFLAKIF